MYQLQLDLFGEITVFSFVIRRDGPVVQVQDLQAEVRGDSRLGIVELGKLLKKRVVERLSRPDRTSMSGYRISAKYNAGQKRPGRF